MFYSSRRHQIALLIGLIFVSFLTVSRGNGEEPFQRFLDKLIERKLFDVANEYLDKMAAEQLLPEKILVDLPLQKLLLLQESLATSSLAEQANKKLVLEKGFKEFLAANPNHPRRTEARLRYADVLLMTGQDLATKGKGKLGTEADREAARAAFKTALELFDSSLAELRPLIESLAGARADTPEKIKLRDNYQGEYRQAEIVKGMTERYVGETYPADSVDYKKWLETAEKDLGDVVSKTSGAREAGRHTLSLLYRGEVQMLLGKVDEAYDSFVRVADIDEAGPFREWRVQATVSLLKLLANPAQGKYETVISRANDLLKTMQSNERKQPEWLDLQVTTAESQLAWAAVLEKQPSTQNKAKSMKSNSRALLVTASKVPGPHHEKAKELLASLGVDTEASKGKIPDFKKFSEGLQAATERIREANDSSLAIEILNKRKEESAPEEKEKIDEEIAHVNEETMSEFKVAEEILAKSLKMYSPDDSREDLIKARFFHSFVAYKQEKYWNSAATGDFTMRTSGGAELGLQAGVIALYSYGKLLEDTSEKESEIAMALESLAAYTVENFPNAKESEQAILTLLQNSMKKEDWEKFEQLMKLLPADGAKSKEILRKFGVVNWFRYLRAMKEIKKNGGQESPTETALRDKAEANLKEGVAALTEETMDQLGVESSNVLAKIYLRTGRRADAIAVLNKEKTGPLFVVRNRPQVVQESAVVLESLSLSLQSMVMEAAAGSNSLDPATVDKLVSEMKGVAGSDDPAKLAGAFVSLAQDIREQLENEKEIPTKAKLADTLSVLLGQVSGISQDVQTVYWSGNTLLNLGNSLTDAKVAPDVVTKMMKAASQAFKKLLDMESKQPGLLANEKKKVDEVKLQLALSKRGEKDFDGSIGLFKEILEANAGLLTAQIEAAKTLQAAGIASKQTDFFKKAMLGTERGSKGKNLIWGFGEMSKNIANKSQFVSLFYESRLGLSQCRYALAEAETQDKAKRTKMMELALGDIRTTVVSSPGVLESEFFKPLDKLCRDIQVELGKPSEGIKGFAPKDN